MLQYFTKINSFFKRDAATIDNKIFRLHYRATTTLLLVFAVVISTKQFIGDPILCFTSEKDIFPKDILNTYCWIQSTFTVPSKTKDVHDPSILSPGVAPSKPDDEKIYHKYYQWVSLFLIFQAILFYFPHYVWKLMENGMINKLRLDLHHPIQITMTPGAAERVQALVDYYMRTRGHHKLYAYAYFFCEALLLVMLLCQMFLTDYFLQGEFTTYGSEVIKFTEMDQDDRNDPMIRIFPRLTKCTFHKYGITGDLQTHDALCVLSLNIVNEKIFILLWFWFCILLILTAFVMIYRFPLMSSSRCRKFDFIRIGGFTVDDKLMIDILDKSNLGDWMLLKRLAENIDAIHFQDMITQLHEAMVSRGIIEIRKEKNKLVEKV